MDEVTRWLEGHGLGSLAGALAENDVGLDVLPRLTEADLREMGFSIGQRRRFLAALEAGVPVPAPAAGRGALAEETAERRQLTVMFCDLVGSTELAARLDPEEVRRVLGEYQDAVARVVAGQGGHVAKLLGDGVLAYFGWPRAHEDATERAVRAGLAAVTRVTELAVGGTALAARVGIATGDVVVGDMIGEAASERGAVVGATPNLAARLQAAAAPGEVAINERTRRLIGGTFTLESLGHLDLRGFADPVPAWRVRAAATITSRFDALHGSHLTRFVGRAHELGLLVDRWREACEGEGQAVLLSGEAGIGKSRLLREFCGHVGGEPARTLSYQCAPHETNAAFHPVMAELATASEIQAEDGEERRLDALETHLQGIFGPDPEVTALLAALLGLPARRYPPLDMAPQRRKQQTIARLVERVARLARQAPPLLILAEDLHWADPSSLEVFDALVDAIPGLPVLMIATARPEFMRDWHGRNHVTAHALSRLGRGAGRSIAAAIAGGQALPAGLIERIVAQTDGVPLFVEELTKSVIEAGTAGGEGAAPRIGAGAAPGPQFSIPATLQDSLMARLDRLAPVKRVIQAAACIGREFDPALLAEALEMEPGALDDALAQLAGAQLIYRRRAAEGARYIFKHALVQDAAYASLLRPVRQKLHARLARSLAQSLERSGASDPLELARHFLAAGAQERAATLYLAAGHDALAASALPEAIGALELGLRALDGYAASLERDRLELDLRVALGAARMANFGWAHPSVAEAMEPAFPLARGVGDREALGSILWTLWVHTQTRTEFGAAHRWLAELERAARENAGSDLSVVFDMSAGCQRFWEADYPGALEHTDRLRAVYDRGRHARITALTNHDPLVFAQHWAGSLADWIAGRPERAGERMEEAIALAREIGHPFNLVFALTAGATSLVYLGDGARLEACCDEAGRVAAEEALGPFSEQVNVMQWRGAAHILRGDFEGGHALTRRGNDFWTASGGRICSAMFRSWIVLGLRGMGRVDEALALNATNIAHCRKTGDRFMEPECLRLQGELEHAQGADGAAGRAAALFREALSVARAHGARSWELRAAMSLARLMRAEGRPDAVAACVEPVLEAFTEGAATQDLIAARALVEGAG